MTSEERDCVNCGREPCAFPHGIPEALCINPEREYTACKLWVGEGEAAIEIKPLPGTKPFKLVEEPPPSLGVLYLILVIMIVGTFIMIHLHRDGVI